MNYKLENNFNVDSEIKIYLKYEVRDVVYSMLEGSGEYAIILSSFLTSQEKIDKFVDKIAKKVIKDEKIKKGDFLIYDGFLFYIRELHAISTENLTNLFADVLRINDRNEDKEFLYDTIGHYIRKDYGYQKAQKIYLNSLGKEKK